MRSLQLSSVAFSLFVSFLFFSNLLIAQNPSLGGIPIALNGVVTALDAEGTALVCADDFIPNFYTKCEIEEVRLVRFFGDIEDATSELEFDCDDVGTQLVAVWVRVGDNWDLTETYIVIEDTGDSCNGGVGFADFSVNLINGLAVNVDDSGEATIHVRDFLTGCNSPDLVYAFSADVTDTLKTFTCADVTTQSIEVWGIADNGASAVTRTYLIVESSSGGCSGTLPGECSPLVQILNGVTLNLPESGVLQLHAADLVVDPRYRKDCAPAGAITYSFSTDPDDQWLRLDCNSPTTFIFSVYATDAIGNQNFSESYILIQDNLNRCAPDYTFVPANDSICQAVSLDDYLDGCPVSFANINATATSEEPLPNQGNCNTDGFWCDGAAEATIWYTFTAPSSGHVTIETSIFDTQLAVWEGTDYQNIADGEGTLVGAADDIAGTNKIGTLLDLTCLIPSQTYYLQIDGYQGAQDFAYFTIIDGGSTCPLSGIDFNCEGVVSTTLLNGTGTWKSFTASDNGYLLSANDNGSYIGIVQAEVQKHLGGIRTDEIGQPYLSRNWAFSAESTPLQDFNIRFYFSQEEFFELAAASTSINTLEDLHLTRVEGGDCGDFALPGEIYAPIKSGVIDFESNTLFAEFKIPDFSAFYLHGPEPLVITNTNQATQTIQYQSISPNPTPNQTNLNFHLAEAANLQVQVLNINGQIISVQDLSLLEGNHQVALDVQHLEPGIYFVIVKSPRERQSLRLIKT